MFRWFYRMTGPRMPKEYVERISRIGQMNNPPPTSSVLDAVKELHEKAKLLPRAMFCGNSEAEEGNLKALPMAVIYCLSVQEANETYTAAKMIVRELNMLHDNYVPPFASTDTGETTPMSLHFGIIHLPRLGTAVGIWCVPTEFYANSAEEVDKVAEKAMIGGVREAMDSDPYFTALASVVHSTRRAHG